MGLSRQTVSCFGSYVVHLKYDRTGHNPHTGEFLTISARKILTFKPITVPEQEINRH
jgi:integration host factor subunit alpha